MKKKFYVLMCLATMLAGVTAVKASDDGFLAIDSESALDECINKSSACRLASNLELNSAKSINGEVILDLNGYTLTADSNLSRKSGLITINRGGKLTVMDSKGTGKISGGSTDKVYAAINLLNDTNNSGGDAEFVLNGGTVEGFYYGIVGNGNMNNTRITINDGTVKAMNKEDSAGIYHPQVGSLVINKGTVSGGSGIEIRSGNLTVNGGTITGIATNFNKVANSGGTTTNGVGIVVAQHVTKNPIKVVINDGKISGQYAFYEWNPQNNSADDLSKIKLQIDGGNFTSLKARVDSVYSQNFTKFISNGTFNTSVSQYLTDDAKVASKETSETTKNGEVKDKKSNKIAVTITVILGLASALGIILYLKKRVI